jgi:hypothetical protein
MQKCNHKDVEQVGAIGATTAPPAGAYGRRRGRWKSRAQIIAELMEQLGASKTNRSGGGATAEDTRSSDAEDAGPAIKQEPQEFIGCVGDFGLDLKPPSN